MGRKLLKHLVGVRHYARSPVDTSSLEHCEACRPCPHHLGDKALREGTCAAHALGLSGLGLGLTASKLS